MPPSTLALRFCLFTCCGVWSPPVEWASCGDMSTFSVLACSTLTQMTPHQVVHLPQQIHSQLVRTQWRTWTGLRSVTVQRAVYIAQFATQCHSCPVEPVLSFAALVLSCMVSACDCLLVNWLAHPFSVVRYCSSLTCHLCDLGLLFICPFSSSA